jgi:NAD(P)-dependent dehydrogenase (short-subunit alcohol dehydrogenase family)
VQLAAGQVAVVTGGASGIGLALTRQLCERGLRVVVADVRSDVTDDVCGRLLAGGADVLGVAVDVRDHESVDRLAAVTLERYGRVDLVCNNAGIVPPRAYSWEQPLSSWRWAVEVMVLGVVHGVRSFVPYLVAQDSGHVLNTASVAGLTPLPGLAPYAAAKAAVVSLTETLAEELQEAAPGVGTTVLCPGLVRTDLAQSSRRNQPTGLSTGAPAVTATGGMEPEEVARAALTGVEARALHVVVGEATGRRARARVERLLADLE